MSPQTGSRRYTHTHLRWFMGTLVFSTLHYKDFSFFLFFFSFLPVHKMHKNVNKRISYFFALGCFQAHFCSLICILCSCLVVFLCFLVLFVLLVLFGTFWCFWCVRNIFVKKNKEFKTALITSFLLLLLWLLY